MKIAIDPGHGMSNRQQNLYDSGATHTENGVPHQEATIALKYGLSLKDVFRARGQDVFMTRDDAQDHAPVGSRAGNAKSAGCEVFISLHLNDFDDDSANGLEVLYRGDDDKVLAQALQDALIAETGFRDRGIKHRTDLAVLRFDGQAVLIELGFIANDGNRDALNNPATREAICAAIATTTLAHFNITPSGPTPPTPGGVPTARVNPPAGDTLTVRGGPGANHPALGTLAAGTIVNIHGSSGRWRKIDPATERWVNSNFLVPLTA